MTATRTSRRLSDVPVRTEVITKEAMRAVQARTLADAVEYTTGVQVESNCQNCNFSQIRLLGLGGPYTQILVDGQPIISSLAQVYGIEHIPARMLERIEVVKGGGSALYGPGSVGGVVNVISREAAASGGVIELRGERAGGGEGVRSGNGAIDLVSRDRQTLFTAFGQADQVEPIDVDGDGFTEVSLRRLGAVGARLNRYAAGGRAKLTLDFTRIDEHRRGGNALDRPPHEADIAEAIDSLRTSLSGSWFHSVSGRFDYRVTMAWADTARDSYYGVGRDPNAYGRTTNTLALVDTQLNHYAGAHTISWGVQHSADALADSQPAYGRLTDATYRNTGVFVQDDWTMAPGWQLLAGARADRHSALSKTVVSPRAAVMWSPIEALDVRVSAARGFRAPQLFDEDLHLSSVAGDVRIILQDPALREESSASYMAGFEWKPELWRGQALVEINAFDTRLADLFHVVEQDDPLTAPFEMLKTNFGRARVHGVEMNLGWGIGDALVLQGGIVEQRARFESPEPDFGSRDFFRTPRRMANATATVRGVAGFNLFAGLRYTGPMLAPHYAGWIDEDRLERTPGFVVADATISRAVPMAGARLVIALTGRNLTNAYQRDLDRGPLRDAAYVYGPRMPRSLALGARIEF
ncbi:MAG TPA: TonB-dependent receptor [Vicinamibacterales bacterium]|nr:TonB-dependent receptor [Vicinamibacterales bacterium]